MRDTLVFHIIFMVQKKIWCLNFEKLKLYLGIWDGVDSPKRGELHLSIVCIEVACFSETCQQVHI